MDVVHESQYWVLCSVKIFFVVLEAQYQVLEVQPSTIFTIKEMMLCLTQLFFILDEPLKRIGGIDYGTQET